MCTWWQRLSDVKYRHPGRRAGQFVTLIDNIITELDITSHYHYTLERDFSWTVDDNFHNGSLLEIHSVGEPKSLISHFPPPLPTPLPPPSPPHTKTSHHITSHHITSPVPRRFSFHPLLVVTHKVRQSAALFAREEEWALEVTAFLSNSCLADWPAKAHLPSRNPQLGRHADRSVVARILSPFHTVSLGWTKVATTCAQLDVRPPGNCSR